MTDRLLTGMVGQERRIGLLFFLQPDVKVSFQYQAITPTTIVALEANFYVRVVSIRDIIFSH